MVNSSLFLKKKSENHSASFYLFMYFLQSSSSLLLSLATAAVVVAGFIYASLGNPNGHRYAQCAVFCEFTRLLATALLLSLLFLLLYCYAYHLSSLPYEVRRGGVS